MTKFQEKCASESVKQIVNQHGQKKESAMSDEPAGMLTAVSMVSEIFSRELKSLHSDRPFTVTTDIDIVQCLLFVLAAVTRFWKLDQPRAIVFDEIFYGRFASMYWKQTFYFDPHPPLGKMLVAAVGSVGGVDQNFTFDRIGTAYPATMPVWWLRAVSALTGSLLVPLTYQVTAELGLSRWTAAVAALLVTLDNALLTQSRLILMEAPLLFSIALATLSYLRLTAARARPLSGRWWFWLTLLGVMATAAVCIKYSGCLSVLLLYSLVCKNFWDRLPLNRMTTTRLCQEAAAVLVCLVLLPVTLYLTVFYVHLSVLHKAGPHDDIMSSAFQASLEGGLASVTRGQPVSVVYGSQVTLRQASGGRPCWLHSHPHVYPLRYGNGRRGSSHQQQVTCYSFKDVNNWWIIKHPERNSLMVEDPVRPVRHGDVVQLIHGLTSRALNSHDVAAPVSPQHQEVSCYIDYNISYPAQNLWRLEIVNPDEDGIWKTIHSQVRLVHINTSQALKTSGRQLPDWGFHQFEVVTDKQISQDATLWNVEEHRYTRTSDKQSTERDLANTEMIPLQPVQLSFWTRFWELQVKMLSGGRDEIEHRYSSDPTEWPFLDRNVAYWYSPQDNTQIQLLGNPVVWLTGSAAVLVYAGLILFYVLRRHRHCWDLEQDEWTRFSEAGRLLLIGYLVNYVPYFMTDKTLFLHNYLPALFFKIMLLAALLEHIHGIVTAVPYASSVYQMLVLVWLTSVYMAFHRLSVLSYGTEKLSSEHIHSLQWRATWDFIKTGVSGH